MKTIPFSYGPKILRLYYNGNAMFAIDRLNGEQAEERPDVLERLQQTNSDGLQLLCRVAVILAQQGECCRRYLQYPAERVPTEQELLKLLTPVQMLGLRSAVIRAISAGWAQDAASADPEEDDIDTGLAELEKKTKL